jgi:hypothetical protein
MNKATEMLDYKDDIRRKIRQAINEKDTTGGKKAMLIFLEQMLKAYDGQCINNISKLYDEITRDFTERDLQSAFAFKGQGQKASEVALD